MPTERALVNDAMSFTPGLWMAVQKLATARPLPVEAIACMPDLSTLCWVPMMPADVARSAEPSTVGPDKGMLHLISWSCT